MMMQLLLYFGTIIEISLNRKNRSASSNNILHKCQCKIICSGGAIMLATSSNILILNGPDGRLKLIVTLTHVTLLLIILKMVKLNVEQLYCTVKWTDL